MVQDPTAARAFEGGGISEVPHAASFNRRRTNISVDITKAFRRTRNGLRVPMALDLSIARETRYQKWLLVSGSGTRPEFMVYESLNRKGLRGPFEWILPAGVDFSYQVPLLGGRGQEGGAVADFVIRSVAPQIVIRVQGEFFHFRDDPTRVQDIIQKIALEAEGFTVIDIVAQDTLSEERVDEVVGYALLGFQVDFTGRIGVFS